VFLPIAESPALDGVRTTLRKAIADAGLAVPGEAGGFWPHISLAYAHASAAAEPVVAAVAEATMAGTPVWPVSAPITRIDLIALRRDDRLYEWLPIAAIPLDASSVVAKKPPQEPPQVTTHR
jgi:hypothetical protein